MHVRSPGFGFNVLFNGFDKFPGGIEQFEAVIFTAFALKISSFVWTFAVIRTFGTNLIRNRIIFHIFLIVLLNNVIYLFNGETGVLYDSNSFQFFE